ncbi:ABC transporter ATP-binding protein [Humitalea sp. 24SJ18S-53]|uniref:ABC transporter ATP-binding protein n=1 Tax=Humitalea sp. 24SJ18S-53 TaxID=3422307 RepID=UPI003D67170E
MGRLGGVVVDQARKAYGTVAALKGVSLTIAPGEFLALVGPSGCGKTTLMRAIAGLEALDAGRVMFGADDVTARRAADRDVAMVFQNYALYPHLTVFQNIAVPLVMRRLNAWQRLPLLGPLLSGGAREKIAADVRGAAESLAIGHLLARKPGQLSGGQRQRVALGRAIVRRPRVFLMDEPLSNLDASLRTETRRELVDLHRRVGAATIYVTHDQSEAMTMADRVAVMMAGEILQVGTPEAIYAEPADLRVAGFVGSPRINVLDADTGPDGRVLVAGWDTGLQGLGATHYAVRPESLVPAADGLPVRLEHIEFLGESLLLHTRHEPTGAALVARLEPQARKSLERGQALHLRPLHGLLFGADGRRVRSLARSPALV